MNYILFWLWFRKDDTHPFPVRGMVVVDSQKIFEVEGRGWVGSVDLVLVAHHASLGAKISCDHTDKV